MLGMMLMVASAPVLAQDAPPRPPQAKAAPAVRPDDPPALTASSRPAARPDKPLAADPRPATDIDRPTTAPNAARRSPPQTAAPVPPLGAGAAPVPAAEPAPPAWQSMAEGALPYHICLLNLTLLGVGYREAAPVTAPEDADCGIARPVRVDSLQPGVGIAGGAVMRCDTARRLALWLRAEAQPAAAQLPGAPRITEILPGTTYECRARIGGASDKLSEHALGNAFDVAGLRFSNGTEMLVAPRSNSGGIEEAFQKAIRYGACLYFTTVLGPGSNAAHGDHLHFDTVARGNGWRLCE